ncbi:MAG: HEPN domain-containing protein [Oscillospiraceae bacterium]|jgi:HEPN domain-containing protein|nr:HEPN domain-containing protein [Oscillospiraceae bacterium]
MDNFDWIELWIEKASEDIRSAEVLLRETLHANSCYHAQQAGEKILKAYLSLCDGSAAWTHNVGTLCKDCMKFNGAFSAILDDASDLTDYATQTRYPGDESFSEQDAKGAIEKARLIFDFSLPRIRALAEKIAQSKEPPVGFGLNT